MTIVGGLRDLVLLAKVIRPADAAAEALVNYGTIRGIPQRVILWDMSFLTSARERARARPYRDYLCSKRRHYIETANFRRRARCANGNCGTRLEILMPCRCLG